MPKKHFSIYARTKEAMLNGLQTERGLFDFRGKSSVNTTNASLVRELEEKYPDQVYSVHDETLSKARDSGSYDIVKTKDGDRVHSLHNYTFSVSKPAPLNAAQKIQKWLTKNGLNGYVWVWDYVGIKDHCRHVGIRTTWFEYDHKIANKS